jgi:hypothetical protein
LPDKTLFVVQMSASAAVEAILGARANVAFVLLSPITRLEVSDGPDGWEIDFWPGPPHGQLTHTADYECQLFTSGMQLQASDGFGQILGRPDRPRRQTTRFQNRRKRVLVIQPSNPITNMRPGTTACPHWIWVALEPSAKRPVTHSPGQEIANGPSAQPMGPPSVLGG